MPAPASNILTYDATPPRRPDVDDVGGTGMQNDQRPGFAPDPVTMPTAEKFNQTAQQLAAFGRVSPLAVLTVTVTGGVPSITDVKALGSALNAGSFTIVDNGVGDTTIWWTASAVLPPTSGQPIAQVTDIDADCTISAVYTTVSSNPAVHVKCRHATTLTDASFVVAIY